MPTPTYTPLAEVTLGSSAASVTFSSISQAYKDIVIVINAKNTVNAQGVRVQYNDDTGTNYSTVYMLGNGSSAASGSSSSQAFADFGVNRTTDTSTIANLFDYSATDKHKTTIIASDNSAEYTLRYANRWASTSAITKIKIYPSDNSFASGSTFALYGIAA